MGEPRTGWSARALFTRRAWRHRCPQCGEGRLFRGYARLEAQCRVCGLVFRRESGSQTGSMYLCAAVTELFAAAVAIAMFLLTDWSVGFGFSVGAVCVLTFSFVFLPISMASWVAVEYAVDVSNGERWATPRW